MARRKSRKSGGSKRSKFAAASKACRRSTKPFTKAFGRCMKTKLSK